MSVSGEKLPLAFDFLKIDDLIVADLANDDPSELHGDRHDKDS